MDAIRLVEAGQLKKDRDGFAPGDTVRVHVKVIEGEKERLQAFEGVVIRKRGEGARASFTVRRISCGVGVERTFPLHSPRIERVEVVRRSRVRRAKLYYLRAVAVGIGVVDHITIDRVNILQATRVAMLEALHQLKVDPDLVITDFLALSGLACPQRNLVDGDACCATVAAASIIAKVTPDRIMLDVDGQFPEYGFARHKGYATAEHLAALDRHGPCPLHRRSFISLWKQGELFPATED